MASESKGIFPHSARNSCSLNTLLQTALQPRPAHSRLPLAIGHVGQTGQKATGPVWGCGMGNLKLRTPGLGTPAWNSQSPPVVRGGGHAFSVPLSGLLRNECGKGRSAPVQGCHCPGGRGSFSQLWRLPYQAVVRAQCKHLGDPGPCVPLHDSHSAPHVQATLLGRQRSLTGFQWFPFIIPLLALLDTLPSHTFLPNGLPACSGGRFVFLLLSLWWS